MSSGRRCVCGRSATPPICDGSHGAEGWVCATDAFAPWCFLAGPHYLTLAERLAHGGGGAAAHRVDRVRCGRLVVLTDGTDLDWIQAALPRVVSDARRVIGLGVDPERLGTAFADFEALRLETEGSGDALWARAQAACEAPAPARAIAPPSSVFLSHAVADEPALQGAVDYLRRTTGAEIFLCADSIPAGGPWAATILDALRARERFVFAVSAASAASTFCAFEVGYALALGLPIGLVSLDGTPPPAFVQHLQAADVPRLLARRPWPTAAEALVEALLGVTR